MSLSPVDSSLKSIWSAVGQLLTFPTPTGHPARLLLLTISSPNGVTTIIPLTPLPNLSLTLFTRNFVSPNLLVIVEVTGHRHLNFTLVSARLCGLQMTSLPRKTVRPVDKQTNSRTNTRHNRSNRHQWSEQLDFPPQLSYVGSPGHLTLQPSQA